MLLVTTRSDAASLDRAAQIAEPFSKSENPAFLDTWGWVQYKRGRYAEAVAALEAAVARAPDAQEIRYHLGMAQLKAGKSAEARKNLEAAVQGDPTYLGADEARAALKGL
jgi:Tfp pilus assembly protein PilF